MAYNGRKGGFGGSHHGARTGGPRLPSDMMDEVEAKYGGPKKAYVHPAARKEMRKAARHPGRAPGPSPPRRSVRPAVGAEEQEGAARSALEQRAGPSKVASSSKQIDVHRSTLYSAKKKRKEITLPEEMDSDTEDAEIEWLEYMLRKEGKGKGKALEDEDDLDDGLDDLLDMADLIGPGGKGLKRKAREDDSDISRNGLEADSSAEGEEDSDPEIEERNLEDVSEASGGEDVEIYEEQVEEFDEDEEAGEEDTNDRRVNSDDSDTESENDDETAVGYGAAPDISTASAAAPSTKYVPPHLRAAQLEAKAKTDVVKAEQLRKLERKAQGLLNRLGEANIESILSEMEGLFRDHSRHDVTTTLTSLILQTISSRSNLLGSFVTMYATLVAALHRVIGVEFAAHFTHTLVLNYVETEQRPLDEDSKLQETIFETPGEGKEALNLLTLLAELYNVGVIGPGLIYDLIRRLLSEAQDGETLSEKGTERLLKLLRASGQQLRHDDPASLKDIASLVSERTKGKEKDMTARARFMIETLTNLKTGKLKSTPGADLDAVNRMKKFLGSLGRKRRLLASDEPLRMSLTDLLAADTRGKWWLVGAGWSGNPLAELEHASVKAEKATTSKGVEKEDEEVLLDLARKQGMNTDVRRGIFVVLLTSEDYLHACERMSMMKLTEVQQRECVRVTFHCASLEKQYNPYYTLILNHLCAESHSHRFTFQYALWDFLRSLEERELGKEGKRRADNLAKTAAFLMGRDTIDLTILKAIDFPPPTLTRAFLYALLAALFVATQTPSPLLRLPKSYRVPANLDQDAIEETFQKSLVNHELAGGLRFIMDGLKGKEGTGVEAELVKAGVKIAKQVLGRVV